MNYIEFMILTTFKSPTIFKTCFISEAQDVREWAVTSQSDKDMLSKILPAFSGIGPQIS